MLAREDKSATLWKPSHLHWIRNVTTLNGIKTTNMQSIATLKATVSRNHKRCTIHLTFTDSQRIFNEKPRGTEVYCLDELLK